jgi:hypothetical protein
MSDIGFTLEELKLFIEMDPSSEYTKDLYNEKKQYLDSLKKKKTSAKKEEPKKKEPEPKPKKSKYSGIAYRENTIKKKGYSTILQGKSDAVWDGKEDVVDTIMKIPDGLAPKIKKVLKSHIKQEIDDKLKIGGSGIELDYSDDEVNIVRKKRGRPRKHT